jgi:hypothetical protein
MAADPLIPWEPFAAAFGLPVIVTLAGESAVPARGIWVAPANESFPAPQELSRREPVRVMALGRDEVPRLPRGTVIEAAEQAGGEVLRWVVDGTERAEVDHVRVYLVPAPPEDEES